MTILLFIALFVCSSAAIIDILVIYFSFKEDDDGLHLGVAFVNLMPLVVSVIALALSLAS